MWEGFYKLIELIIMAENSGRGYLPPTVPNPSNPHRRQWPVVPSQGPPTFYSAPQPWHVSHGLSSKPFLVHGSSSPQSEGIDLTSRPATGTPDVAHNGSDSVNGQLKETAASVSVIAPNPLVQHEESKLVETKDVLGSRPPFDTKEGIGSKAPFDRPAPIGFTAAGESGKTASFPGVSRPELTGHPAVHPLTTKLPEQAGISTPFVGKALPAESEGQPAHPVESKVSVRLRDGGKPVEPSIAPAELAPALPIPEVAPSEEFTDPGVPKDEPSLPAVVPTSVTNEPTSTAIDPPVGSEVPTIESEQPSTEQSSAASPTLQIDESPDEPQPPGKQTSSSPDHVESLLANMFHGGDESPLKQSVIVTNTKAPVLTDDKVVAILEDKSPVDSIEVKKEIKTEPDKKNKFMEVESELEKMFAGIVEDDADNAKPSTGLAAEGSIKTEPIGEIAAAVKTEVGTTKKKKRPSGKSRPRKLNEASNLPIPAKRRRKSKGESGSNGRGKGVKKVLNDKLKEGSDNSNLGFLPKKGPYVHIEGTKEIPSAICIVNSEEERDRGIDKVMGRRKHHTHVEGRLKGSGLYASTLSNKYNTQSADLSWVCIFCKLRSNCEKGLGGEPAGDLFGPYILTIPKEAEEDPRVPKDSDIVAEQKRRGGGKQLSLRAAGAVEQFVKDAAKKNKKLLNVNEDLSGEREIWVHEKCAVWAPGVFLVGPHLVGLAEAVSAAVVTKCSYCSHFGASLGCVIRGCPVRCHYGCAVATRWELNYDSFIAKCPNHVKKF